MKVRVALVISHPIQHFCPQYVSFATNNGVEFKVFFASRLGLEKYVDVQFNREISWGNLQLEKFAHQFLTDAVIQPDKNIDAPNLDKALTQYKPDLVIVYGYYQKLQRRARNWAIDNKVKLAYISDSERRQARGWVREMVKYPFVWNYFRHIDYFLSVGDANEEFYSHYCVAERKILRMHFPIDLELYRRCYPVRRELALAVRNKYDIPDGEIILSVVGKLVSWKNQDHIIDAIKKLETEGIFVTLFMIGSGELMEFWKQKAAGLSRSKVIFTGFVNIEDLPGYYAATDIYIHPASVEPHSIAISEAIYMGCPVIISDKCGSYGPNDDVQDGINGYIFEFSNIDDLASKIRLLVNDLETRNAMAKSSHEISVVFQERSHFGVLTDLISKISS